MDWLQSAGLGIEVAEVVLHKADEPDTVRDLLDADLLAGEDGGEVDLPSFVADPPTARDQRGPIMKGILEILQAPIGPGGFFVLLRGHLHLQRLVRPVLVEVADEVVEAGLLDEEVLGSRLGGFLLEREVHALVAAVLLGMAGLDALDVDA